MPNTAAPVNFGDAAGGGAHLLFVHAEHADDAPQSPSVPHAEPQLSAWQRSEVGLQNPHSGPPHCDEEAHTCYYTWTTCSKHGGQVGTS